MNYSYLISFGEVDKDTFQVVAGWIGNALALFFFFSPAIGMYKLIKEQIDYKVIPYISLIANILNCLLWFIYGYKKEDLQIYLCNAIGGVTNIIYLIIFWYYFSEKNLTKYLGFLAATIVSLGEIFAVFMFFIEGYEVTGYHAMIFNIIMYAAPGQKIVNLFINLKSSSKS
jgi:hypothetical protein